jgi:hypothetical protein
LDKYQYPYEHAQGNVSVKSAILPADLDVNIRDFWVVSKSFEVIDDRFHTLLLRIYNELIAVAEKVETVIGLPPLPDPYAKHKSQNNDTKTIR